MRTLLRAGSLVLLGVLLLGAPVAMPCPFATGGTALAVTPIEASAVAEGAVVPADELPVGTRRAIERARADPDRRARLCGPLPSAFDLRGEYATSVPVRLDGEHYVVEPVGTRLPSGLPVTVGAWALGTASVAAGGWWYRRRA